MAVVLGTAGHIDHGKTSLVRALTGIDCDRLEEEKRRGITIELGFAWVDLPGGERLGIVDVPGHERFVKNMVAGAAGAYLATEPGISVPNQAFVDRAETDEVLTAASTNVQRLVSIDHESLDEYHDSLGEFLTPNLVEELDANWPALRDSYEQSATTVDAQVREAGLSYLEGDRAEVLLVQDVSMERDGAAAGSTSGTYLVGLDRVDGVWKLSKIPDLPS